MEILLISQDDPYTILHGDPNIDSQCMLQGRIVPNGRMHKLEPLCSHSLPPNFGREVVNTEGHSLASVRRKIFGA